MRSSARCSPSRLRAAATAGTVVVACFALVLSVVACSSGAPAASGGSAPTISGAWVRPPQGMSLPTAGYLVITGGSQADALLGASSPVAGSVEVHETTTDMSGMTGMHPISRLEIPAGGTVTLQPGGYHLMLMMITGQVTVGGTVQLDLTFEKAGKITVRAEVKQS